MCMVNEIVLCMKLTGDEQIYSLKSVAWLITHGYGQLYSRLQQFLHYTSLMYMWVLLLE